MEKENDMYKEWAQEAYENILDALDQIKTGHVTILTGDNGTGKSLIRKVLCSSLRNQENDDTIKITDISMEKRTGLHAGLGGGGVFFRDVEWVATSDNSLSFLYSLLNSAKDRYLVLDEPELGMSQDLQKSIGIYLSKRIPETMKENRGMLIITHSREFVRSLSVEHVFVNLQKKSEEEWLNESAKEIDLDDFRKKCDALFNLLRDHLKSSRDW